MSDHWNDLANLIGADVPKQEPTKEEPSSPGFDEGSGKEAAASGSSTETPEPPPSPQAPPITGKPPEEPVAKIAEQAKGPRPEPPKPRNHWQKVAGALGLAFGKSEPKPESVEVEPPATEVPRNVDDQLVVDRAEVPGDVDEHDRAPSERESDTTESALPAAEEKPSMFGFGWESKGVRATSDAPNSEELTGATPNVETLFGETPDKSESEEAYDKKHAERELAALFSDPVDTSIEGLEFTPGEHTEEDSKPRYVDDVTIDETLDSETESAGSGDLDTDDGGPRRGRRRRRGGRRRRRDDKRQTSADDPEDTDQLESSEVADPTAVPAVSTPSAFGRGIIDQEEATPIHEEAKPSESVDEDRRSKRFRNIRSWKDTIATIVDANIAARGNSPAPRGSNGGGGRRRRGGGKRGSGSGRGRPRRGGGGVPNSGDDS